MSYKKTSGNSLMLLIISIFFIILFFMLFFFLILSFQIWFYTSKVKSDLFYIVNNSYISFDNQELAYNNYILDLEDMKYNIEKLLESNLDTNITIEEIEYENTNLFIKVKVGFEPVIKLNDMEYIFLTIEDNIKLEMLGVENE